MKKLFKKIFILIITEKRIAILVIILMVLGVIALNKIKTIPARQYQTEAMEYKDPNAEAPGKKTNQIIYENAANHYQISYPESWKVFPEDAETDLAEMKVDDGQTAKLGGTVFFSNKDNIDYTEESRPEDFRLLGLIIYEKEETSLDEFANFLGFSNETETYQVIFKADNIVGKEYISIGAAEENPRAAIIFKDNNRFYVFHLGFIGNDKETLKTMEEIVGSFRVGEDKL